ncbi:unnamed protein product, partial [marine sediment metagenome]
EPERTLKGGNRKTIRMNNPFHTSVPGEKLLTIRKRARGKARLAKAFGVRFRYQLGKRVVAATAVSIICPFFGKTDPAKRYMKATYKIPIITGTSLWGTMGSTPQICEI